MKVLHTEVTFKMGTAARLVLCVEIMCLLVGEGLARGLGEHRRHRSMVHARVSALKHEILDKLGLSKEPQTAQLNATVSEKRAMLKLYKKSIEETEEQSHSIFDDVEVFAKRFYSFTDTGKAGQVQGSLRLHFPVLITSPSDHLQETVVQSASLRLYVSDFSNDLLQADLQDKASSKRLVLNVYQLLKPTPDKTPRRLITSSFAYVDQPGWIKIDITKVVTEWCDDPSTNVGIEITCDDFDINEVMTIVHSQHKEDLLPTLTVYTHEQAILGRRRRETNHDKPFNCVQEDDESRCCRYPLWVSFADIGWDWVLAPDGFQAYYCDGSCPYKFRAAHRFSSIQSLIHLLYPGAAPAPCCTPTRLQPLSLLHITGYGSMAVTQFSDMIIDNCGCA